MIQTGDLPFSLVKPSIKYWNGFVILLGGHRFETGDFNTDILTFKIAEQRWHLIQKCIQDFPVVIHQTLSIDSYYSKIKSFLFQCNSIQTFTTEDTFTVGSRNRAVLNLSVRAQKQIVY